MKLSRIAQCPTLLGFLVLGCGSNSDGSTRVEETAGAFGSTTAGDEAPGGGTGFGGTHGYAGSIAMAGAAGMASTLEHGDASSAESGAISGCGGAMGSSTPSDAASDAGFLRPGLWKNVAPPVDLHLSAAGVLAVAIDPSHPGTVYAGIEKFGIWKSTDRGTSWAQLGNPADVQNFDSEEGFLDMPINIAVDPSDSRHLYATQGVRGRTAGFFVSRDGGNSWTRPKGFSEVSPTTDVTTMDIDPSDFRHILLGSHTQDPVGVLESSDGGDSWTLHRPPPGGFAGAGSYGVNFLFHPATCTGDRKTWLVVGNGMWRTTDSGATWSKVAPFNGVHHGTDRVYYTSAGVVYSGGGSYPVRSTDNGLTWTEVKSGLVSYSYHTIRGDGKRLYTLRSAYYNVTPSPPFATSLESDGFNFAPYSYEGTTQTFFQGPVQMRFDERDRVLYSAHWETGGLWALKAVD